MTNIENLRKGLEVLQVLATLDMTAMPIEPSRDMIEAGIKSLRDSGVYITDRAIRDLYAAMLLAHDDRIIA